MTFYLTHKQLLELKFWIEEKAANGYDVERKKLPLYMQAFDLPRSLPGWKHRHDVCVLEVGTGPYWGLLQYLRFGDGEWQPRKLVAVDPLFDAYDACSLLEDRGIVQYASDSFENWDTDSEQFDAVITTNSLDHGEMGFYLLPKIWRLLKPGGKFFLHVHLRPMRLRNLLHDHSLTRDQLARSLKDCPLVEEKYEILPNDVDGEFCETIVGVWRKP